QNTRFLWRNCSRDSAYAARLAVTTVRIAVSADVRKLATYQRRMSVSLNDRTNAPNVGSWISQVALVVSAFGFSAVSSAQASGTSHRIANAMRTPRQIRLKSFS